MRRLANVFISYARRDKARVAQLTAALENEGLSVWWDSELVPGRRYREVIDEQLSQADCILVVWTAAALESDWVQDEAEEGRQRGVLIPVVLEPVRPPAGFRQVQAADLSQWTGSPQHPEFRSLVFAVRSLVQIARAARRVDPSVPGEPVARAADGPPPPAPDPVPAPAPSAAAIVPQERRSSASTTVPGVFAATAFSWLWWAGATFYAVVAVTLLNAADGSSEIWPYVLALPPAFACAVALVCRRAALEAKARVWVALASLAGGGLVALFALWRMESGSLVEMTAVISVLAIAGMGLAFAFATPGALALKRVRSSPARRAT